MNKVTFSFLLALIVFVTGCPDPSLLSTPLRKGYTYHSNGGEFGYVLYKGQRLADYFGILRNGKEKWCTDFALVKVYFVCKYVQYGNAENYKEIEYFFLNTETGNIQVFHNIEEAKLYWKQITGFKFPQLKRKIKNTKTI